MNFLRVAPNEKWSGWTLFFSNQGAVPCAAHSCKSVAPQVSLLHSPPGVLTIALWINFYSGKSEEGVTFIVHKWITLDSIADPPLPTQRQGDLGRMGGLSYQWTPQGHPYHCLLSSLDVVTTVSQPDLGKVGKQEGAELWSEKSAWQTYTYIVIIKEDIKMCLNKLITFLEHKTSIFMWHASFCTSDWHLRSMKFWNVFLVYVILEAFRMWFW